MGGDRQEYLGWREISLTSQILLMKATFGLLMVLENRHTLSSDLLRDLLLLLSTVRPPQKATPTSRWEPLKLQCFGKSRRGAPGTHKDLMC
jgi:hypothetical protein